MNLIQNISSILKTWVFKNRVLKFSSKHARDPMACFYCPEMCRFSCPTAESLKSNAVTPRGKMSLLHLNERGETFEKTCGSLENALWYLEQCTGCGRCTEFCLHEVDVASNLRLGRQKIYESLGVSARTQASNSTNGIKKLKGKILLVEPERVEWWRSNFKRFHKLNAVDWVALPLPVLEWQQGLITKGNVDLQNIAAVFEDCSEIVVESPSTAWFLAKGLKDEFKILKPEVRLLWQYLFPLFISTPLEPDSIVHESFHLSRLLPRQGYSIPMYEKSHPPFHFGWNSFDCGGEGFYQKLYPETAKNIGEKFISDLSKDGRELNRIIVLDLGCKSHLQKIWKGKIEYWMDEVVLNEF